MSDFLAGAAGAVWRRSGLFRDPARPGAGTSARALIRPHRPIIERLSHAPQALRAFVRADEIWLVVLAAFVGCLAGAAVTAMSATTQTMHELLFALEPGARISAQPWLDPRRVLLVPLLGGLVVGLFSITAQRWMNRPVVDPIEANALHGGRMSLRDSLIVMAQTTLSNGFGASVGLEAGFTQIAAALASRIGHWFRLRRNDMRVLVGCGAAGAIAAAFNAPLTGAFYAFELVIGTYSLATLAPVMVAAIAAIAVSHALGAHLFGFNVWLPEQVSAVDYPPLVALGILCALAGIAIMRGVTLTETLFRRIHVPIWARPAIGGLAVGGLALVTPQVLSSGHGALTIGVDTVYAPGVILLLIVMKALASAISLGSGFRGGLFFASLLLGAFIGKLFAAILVAAPFIAPVPTVVCAVVGMSALAVAIVGGPLTMAFLALESTGSLPLTIAVVAASLVSALTVRRTFGYSFATWRFHLRGEAIRSAVDVGWVRNLTVGRMMRREVRTVRADTTLAAFRRDFPLGAASRVIAVDETERYAGIVLVPEAHGETTATRIAELLHYGDAVLLPQMTVKEAAAMFEAAEADALAVIDTRESRRVLGLLTEQYALRRYSEELDRRRRELSGE